MALPVNVVSPPVNGKFRCGFAALDDMRPCEKYIEGLLTPDRL